MNIIIANDFGFVNGGGSQVAISSALSLSKRGHRIIFFCAAGPPCNELIQSGIEIVCCQQSGIYDNRRRLQAAVQGIWNFSAARQFKRLLKRFNPEDSVVHIHSWTRALSSSIIPVARKAHFRLALSNHDYSLACPNGAFFNYRKNEICKLRPLSGKCLVADCDKRRRYHKWWRLIRSYIQNRKGGIPSQLENIIFVSDFSRQILEPYCRKDARFRVMENPISVEKEEPARPGGNRSFIAVGRLDPEKGPILFARAALNAGIIPRFIGDGECRSDILYFCPEARISGWVDHDEVIKSLRYARALVFPSLTYETFGLTVLEAAAVGIPAIVPHEGAASDLVIDGLTGLKFRGGQVDDLAEKLLLLKNDDYLTDRLGKNAYDKYWSNPHQPRKHAEQLEMLYQQMLA